jgi:RNA polymerase sigma-70 factor, ECF subfamily
MSNDAQPDSPYHVDVLVVRAHSDREAFGQLYDLYYDRVFRYCIRHVFRRCVAEEVCSETFLYVAANMRNFRGTTEREFRCWLYGIATNTAKAHIRHTRRRDELTLQAIERKALGPTAKESTSSEYEPADWAPVYQSIAELGARDQAIVTLRFFAEMSYDDIAVTLKLQPGTVRVALSRAIAKLRRLLSAHEEFADLFRDN